MADPIHARTGLIKYVTSKTGAVYRFLKHPDVCTVRVSRMSYSY